MGGDGVMLVCVKSILFFALLPRCLSAFHGAMPPIRSPDSTDYLPLRTAQLYLPADLTIHPLLSPGEPQQQLRMVGEGEDSSPRPESDRDGSVPVKEAP